MLAITYIQSKPRIQVGPANPLLTANITLYCALYSTLARHRRRSAMFIMPSHTLGS
jgi:hypothetical protein